MNPPVSKIICPGCRSAFDADTNFCSRCGTSLRASSAAMGDRKTEPVMTAMSDEPRQEHSEARDPMIGLIFDGRYKVIERIGAGGMGMVYKVEHQHMGKIAAMKVLHRDLADDAEVVRRFRREAEAVSKLASPHTVQVFDFGTADGVLYLVMEYVRGDDLGTIVRRDGPMPFLRAATIFIQICDALAEAHELGIVHRDLKPENILVGQNRDGHDHAKVLDFGLAKLSEANDSAGVTGRNEIIGTPFYMSPEQIRGEELGTRSDIYSLGAVMYRVLTGETPFNAASPVGVLTRALTDDLVPPRRRKPEANLPVGVDDIIVKAMARAAADRYPTVEALKADLVIELAAASGPPRRFVESRPLTPTSSRPALQREDYDAYERSLRRTSWLRGIVGPMIFVVVAGAGIFYWRWQRAQPQSVEHEPNDDLATATPIGPGHAVHGKIGVRQTPDQGDRDYYRLQTGARPGAPRVLRATLTSIPNADLLVAAFDANGRQLAVADASGVGEKEILPNLGVTTDPVYLEVVESREGPAHPPTENLSDEYSLEVTLEAPAADEELEPNDVESEANPLALGQTVSGTLARSGDTDVFRFTGTDGKYDIEMTGADSARVTIKVGDVALKGRRGKVAFKAGTLVTIERTDDPVPGPGGRAVTKGTDERYGLRVYADSSSK